MDRKSTLVSVVPFGISEFKPGIYPGFFELPPSINYEPQILVIGDSVYHVEIDVGRIITVKCPSDDIARSVVYDYVTANLAYSAEDNSGPGLFWVSGAQNHATIKSNFSKQLQDAKNSQIRWFNKLITMADDDWEKSRQHKFISDMQRFAAKSLGLNRPWVVVPPPPAVLTTKCPACQSLISPDAVICPSCRCIINMDKYKSFQFASESVGAK